MENKVKNLIISRYGTLSNFCEKIDLPYSTVDSILKRGFVKANVLNVIKICDELGISIDSLKQGIIKPIETKRITRDDVIFQFKSLLDKDDNLSEQQKQHLINTLNIFYDEKK